MKAIEYKYVVLQRYYQVNSTIKYITVIMVLSSKEKAEALAKFLNDNQYFESEVTVERADVLINDNSVNLTANAIFSALVDRTI